MHSQKCIGYRSAPSLCPRSCLRLRTKDVDAKPQKLFRQIAQWWIQTIHYASHYPIQQGFVRSVRSGSDNRVQSESRGWPVLVRTLVRSKMTFGTKPNGGLVGASTLVPCSYREHGRTVVCVLRADARIASACVLPSQRNGGHGVISMSSSLRSKASTPTTGRRKPGIKRSVKIAGIAIQRQYSVSQKLQFAERRITKGCPYCGNVSTSDCITLLLQNCLVSVPPSLCCR